DISDIRPWLGRARTAEERVFTRARSGSPPHGAAARPVDFRRNANVRARSGPPAHAGILPWERAVDPSGTVVGGVGRAARRGSPRRPDAPALPRPHRRPGADPVDGLRAVHRRVRLGAAALRLP